MSKTVAIELCSRDHTTPETVLRGFIADLCGITNLVSSPRTDGYNSHGSDEREMAWSYYDRADYNTNPEALWRWRLTSEYRIVYMQRIAGRLFMLHSFVKKSAKTSRKDLNIAKNRLKQVQARLLEEKQDAKKRK